MDPEPLRPRGRREDGAGYLSSCTDLRSGIRARHGATAGVKCLRVLGFELHSSTIPTPWVDLELQREDLHPNNERAAYYRESGLLSEKVLKYYF